MKPTLTLLLLLGMALYSHSADAQDFVYEPKNPSFGGGNTFNYSWLLSSAQAQNTIEDPAAKPAASRTTDPLATFQQSLNQQILSQLSRQFVLSQFGANGITEGSYNIGSYQIVVTPNGTGVDIQITDTGTGNQTTITVPSL